MKKILITGASRGLGKALATELTDRKYLVIACSRNLDDLANVPAKWKYSLDVTNAESVAELVSAIGTIDILINNAAYSAGGPVETLPLEEVAKVYETNVIGPLRLIQEFVPGMRDQKSGLIINISSAAARFGPPYGGLYSSSKAALEMLSEALWFELKHFGIRVILAEPGAIRTDMAKKQKTFGSAAYSELSEQMKKRYENFTKEDKRTLPEDIAAQVADLINEESGSLRFPLGQDGNYLVKTRTSLDDRQWEKDAPFIKGLNW
ncbi:MAG: SDR family oxidoreductase [Ginsengibacter sp.]